MKAYGLDRASFNQGENAQYDFSVLQEQQPTLTAKGPGGVCYCIGNGQVDQLKLSENVGALDCMHDEKIVLIKKVIRYIVRRLTPTECARLQGFPDDWSDIPKKDDMTNEEVAFWNDVYITHQRIVNGKEAKPKTKEQLIRWYNKLHTDSAEYKMWGNGVALPCVRVPIHGMAKYGAKTLGSLFDGSGGFPLAGVLDGIEPLWASEIEPYPIAVTVARFDEDNHTVTTKW